MLLFFSYPSLLLCTECKERSRADTPVSPFRRSHRGTSEIPSLMRRLTRVNILHLLELHSE
jgi:hypothetical protein